MKSIQTILLTTHHKPSTKITHTRKFKTSLSFKKVIAKSDLPKKNFIQPELNPDFNFSKKKIFSLIDEEDEFEMVEKVKVDGPAVKIVTLPLVDVREMIKEQGESLFKDEEMLYNQVLTCEKLEKLLDGEVPGIEMDVLEDPVLDEMLRSFDSYLYKMEYEDEEVWEWRNVRSLDYSFIRELSDIKHTGYYEHQRLVNDLIAMYKSNGIIPHPDSCKHFLRPGQILPEDKVKIMNLYLSYGVTDPSFINMMFKQLLDSVRKTALNPRAETAKILKRILVLTNYIDYPKDDGFYYTLVKGLSRLDDNAYIQVAIKKIMEDDIEISEQMLVLFLRLIDDKTEEVFEIIKNEPNIYNDPYRKYPLIMNSVSDKSKIALYAEKLASYCVAKDLKIPEYTLIRLAGNNLLDETLSVYSKIAVRGTKLSHTTYATIMYMLFQMGQYDMVISFFKEMLKFKVRPGDSIYNVMLRTLNAKKKFDEVVMLYNRSQGFFKPSRETFEEIITVNLEPAYLNYERLAFFSQEYDRIHKAERTWKEKVNSVCQQHGWKSPFARRRFN